MKTKPMEHIKELRGYGSKIKDSKHLSAYRQVMSDFIRIVSHHKSYNVEFLKELEKINVRQLTGDDIRILTDMMVNLEHVEESLCMQMLPNLSTVISSVDLAFRKFSAPNGEEGERTPEEMQTIYKLLALYMNIFYNNSKRF